MAMDKEKVIELVHEVHRLEMEFEAKVKGEMAAEEAKQNAFIAKNLVEKALIAAREQLAKAMTPEQG